VDVYLICRRAIGLPNEVVMPVRRAVSGADVPAAAVLELFRPLTAVEEGAGYATWVLEPGTIGSARTQGAALVVDFGHQLEMVNNVNTSNGAGTFFNQLARTAFQFHAIQRVVATIEASESRFCTFFQRGPEPGCGVIRRTMVPEPQQLVDTRNRVPEDPQQYTTGGEWLDSAIVLPDGGVFVAVRTNGFSDLCSAAIYRIDPATGARTFIANGREPQVSPDGRQVVYATVAQADDNRGPGCAAVDISWRPVDGGAVRRTMLRPASRGTVAIGLQWSPDSRKVSMILGFDFSEASAAAVLDTVTGEYTMVRVSPELGAAFSERTGADCSLWRPWPYRWLSDGSLVAAVWCWSSDPVDSSTLPRWWHVPADGVLASLGDAVTDPSILAQLPMNPWS
jgi:hypothetical protein